MRKLTTEPLARSPRSGVILNEKRGSPPLFGGIRRVACTLLRKDAWLCHRQLFPRTFLLLLCFFDSLKPQPKAGFYLAQKLRFAPSCLRTGPLARSRARRGVINEKGFTTPFSSFSPDFLLLLCFFSTV
ncbi:MAG: hypothetical protein ACLTOS_12230 [Ruthenibacterium lactatiformans]